jgi:hypothetical protein
MTPTTATNAAATNAAATTAGKVPLVPVFLERVTEVRDSPKFFKILRIEIENKLSHPHDNGNVSNRSSVDIDLFNTNLSDEK